MTREPETPDKPGEPVGRYARGVMVERERGYCGIHAPSRIEARKASREATRAAATRAQTEAEAEIPEPIQFGPRRYNFDKREYEDSPLAILSPSGDALVIECAGLGVLRTVATQADAEALFDLADALSDAARKANRIMRARADLLR